MKVKLYNIVKKVLAEKPETRSSDKKLIWEVLKELGFVKFLGEYSITYESFMDAPSFETIRRTRQKFQEDGTEFQATARVKKFRKEKQAEKGTHIYRETSKVACYDNVTGKTIYI